MDGLFCHDILPGVLIGQSEPIGDDHGSARKVQIQLNKPLLMFQLLITVTNPATVTVLAIPRQLVNKTHRLQ